MRPREGFRVVSDGLGRVEAGLLRRIIATKSPADDFSSLPPVIPEDNSRVVSCSITAPERALEIDDMKSCCRGFVLESGSFARAPHVLCESYLQSRILEKMTCLSILPDRPSGKIKILILNKLMSSLLSLIHCIGGNLGGFYKLGELQSWWTLWEIGGFGAESLQHSRMAIMHSMETKNRLHQLTKIANRAQRLWLLLLSLGSKGDDKGKFEK
ncbi:hypothetical protein SELMODRAFT_417701 [Selaginella moellendorffii]|uniref:Uncharacterized protein n=1 Tax=Selaginella moellendorffii TaxID=88036 RepID=D8S3B1_SELML|nr:hypothetical protein SELMODRAFT_417701 [Selaginella moellendorffii]